MKTRRAFLKKLGYSSLASSLLPLIISYPKISNNQPNILWLSCEDISPNLGCYGDKYAKTPTLDQLASIGILYTNAYTVAGVCAPNRSSIITGMFASTLGTQNMRSGGEGVERSNKPHLPPSVKCFPEFLREAGYYCTNNAKEDYNFVTPSTAWDESSNKAHWKNRPAGKPFFAVFNHGGTHEGSIRLNEAQRTERTKRLTPEQRQDRQKLEPPPYYPDTPTTREYWARYYELITAMDYWVADHLNELKNDGLSEDTIVFFWSDHGVGLPRAKRWIYDSGTHIPLIVYIPKKFHSIAQITPGIKDDQLVNSIDFAPTVLNLVGSPLPSYMQGRPFLGKNLPPERQFIYGIRDRMDERYDTIRSVRDKRYRYLINYRCFKPYYQYMQSAERGPVMEEIRRLEKLGELPEKVALFTAKQKPPEELYDLHNDPHEVNNLADKPEFFGHLKKMREEHLKWMLKTRDTGLIPEAEIVRLEKQFGNRMAILQQPDSEEFLKELQNVALLAGRPDLGDQKALENYLDNQQPAIRFWAVTGIGNLTDKNPSLLVKIESKIEDESSTVRVAVARTLFKMGKSQQALSILKRELKSDAEWVRLSVAIVLDEMGENSRPLIPEMNQALEDKENKYVVRVVNHTLNNLLGTNNRVR